MKAVLLAGGTGSRMAPCTLGVNKHLLPVHDQPVIYHPLALLMRAGIREIAMIVRPEDQGAFYRLLGDGERLGISISYVSQPEPLGIAHAVALAEPFAASERFCVALGDGLFLSDRLPAQLAGVMAKSGKAEVFACEAASPQDFAVLEVGQNDLPLALVEKPEEPRSDLVVPGLYVYEPDVFSMIRNLAPSARGELEITALNNAYLAEGRLSVTRLEPDASWLDLGTIDRLNEAAELVRNVEARTAIKPGCPEMVAWENQWISKDALIETGRAMRAFLRPLSLTRRPVRVKHRNALERVEPPRR